MRNRASHILKDELSDNTLKHIQEIDYLEDWIVDAMITFHQNEINIVNHGKDIKNCCSPTDGFFLGTTCPHCNKPFRKDIK